MLVTSLPIPPVGVTSTSRAFSAVSVSNVAGTKSIPIASLSPRVFSINTDSIFKN